LHLPQEQVFPIKIILVHRYKLSNKKKIIFNSINRPPLKESITSNLKEG
jgi:hypothetical protein